MHWEEHGEGEPVVFLHGIPTSPRLWRHVIPQLPGVRALAWEMVGYGASIPEGPDRDISVARQADYLVLWMHEIGLERAVLVGHDLGGGIAQIVAVRHREMVSGLVLMNAVCYDSWPILLASSMRFVAPLSRRLPNVLTRLVVYYLLFRRGHDSRARAAESFAQHWPYYEATDAAETLMRQICSLDVHDTLAIADQIPRLDLPARLVWGAADQFQEIGYGYRLAYDLRARLDRIEGGKHFVPEDHPDRVAAAVDDLIRQVTDLHSAA